MLLCLNAPEEGAHHRESLFITALLVSEALQPQIGTGPLLAGFEEVADSMIQVLSNGQRNSSPEPVIGQRVVLVSAGLKGEGEKGSAHSLESESARHLEAQVG